MRLTSILIKLLLLATVSWAEQGILTVQVKDIQQRPVLGAEVAVDGATEPSRTVTVGLARIRLDSGMKVNDWVSFNIIKSPPGKAFVIISLWDSRIQVPLFDNNTTFVTVIV